MCSQKITDTRIKRYSSNDFKIEFCGDDPSRGNNFYSILIGENGCGKSRLLKQMITALTHNNSDKKRQLVIHSSVGNEVYELNFQRNALYTSLFGKKTSLPRQAINVLAFTGSISDKLPSSSQKYLCNYLYLGPVERNEYLLGAKNFLDSAIMNLLFSLVPDRVGSKVEKLSKAFEFINYESKFHIIFHVGSKELYKLKDASTKERAFKKYLADNYQGEIGDSEIKALQDYYYRTASWLKKKGRTSVRLIFDLNDNKCFEKSLAEFSYIKLLSEIKLFKDPVVKLLNCDKREVNSSDLSSGESLILTSMLKLATFVRENSIIIIDEPEISLHPHWQSRYVYMLDSILGSDLGCHIIMATHSHIVVSNLPHDRSEVLRLEPDKGIVSATAYTNTSDLSAEEIMLEIFNLPTTRNYYLSLKLQELLVLASVGKTDSEDFFRLGRELREITPNLNEKDPILKIIRSLDGDNNE